MTQLTAIARRAAPHPPTGLRAPAVGIALSGGGYRAMLFHLGALRRLNELGVLSTVSRFSSVSGGSIAAAALAVHWDRLDFDERGVARHFGLVEDAVHNLASRTIDVPSAMKGLVPLVSPADAVAAAYRRHLLGDANLQDLPNHPRFTFNTTNFATGALVRWAKEYVADYRIGSVFAPDVPLADVVAASSAFPPMLSPKTIVVPGTLVDHGTRQPKAEQPRRLVLTDGGVYDNLGLEPLKSFHTILASDGGAPFDYGVKPRRNWLSQSLRTTAILSEQSRANRRRQLVSEFTHGRRLGALWTIATKLGDYPATTLPVAEASRLALCGVPTRLRALDEPLQKRLVNWGYVQADAAVRSYVESAFAPPVEYPHPEEALG